MTASENEACQGLQIHVGDGAKAKLVASIWFDRVPVSYLGETGFEMRIMIEVAGLQPDAQF